jgi:hypothetical protein
MSAERSTIHKGKDAPVEGTSDIFILQDVSASMKKDERLKQCNMFSRWLADSLPQNDRLGYVMFDSQATSGFPLTSIDKIRDERTLESLLSAIHAQGKTALYEAIFAAAGQIFDKSRSVWFVVMSGGADDTSCFSVAFIDTLLGRFPNLHLCFVQFGEDVPIHKRFADMTSGSYHLINHTLTTAQSGQVAVDAPVQLSSSLDEQVSTFDKLGRQLFLTEVMASVVQGILSNIHPNLVLSLPTQPIANEPTM